MKFEKIVSKKFTAFTKAELSYPQAIYGGYKGETSTSTQSDQIKSGGNVDYTDHGSGGRNDGFSMATADGPALGMG